MVLGFLIIILVLLLGGDFFKKLLSGTTVNRTAAPSFREPKIDFTILQSQALKDLESFEGIKPFDGETGRENPFIPY